MVLSRSLWHSTFELQPTKIDIINLDTLLLVTEKRVYPTDDKFWRSRVMQLVQNL